MSYQPGTHIILFTRLLNSRLTLLLQGHGMVDAVTAGISTGRGVRGGRGSLGGRGGIRGRGRRQGSQGGREGRTVAQEIQDEAVAIDPHSHPSFLSESFHGSPRHLRCNAINALHLVADQGPSQLFITLTCNKKWPEFTEVLWPNTDVFDLPGIVTEVFHAKLMAILHNLRNGKYFGADTTVFILHVIEYQVFL